MERKIIVSAVSYLNTKPLLYGLENHPVQNQMELTLEYPSLIAQHLIDGSVDLGLVSTAALPLIPNAKIVSNYGIAASGKVASVCIYGKKPLENLTTIYLDYQSRTSVKLAEILLKKYWKKEVKLVDAPQNYIDLIDDTTGAVIIGDRALKANHDFPYVYDLAETWKKFTGLDFVFAAWIANKPLPPAFLEAFETAMFLGLKNIDTVASQIDFPYYDLKTYYHQNIKYQLDDNKRKGLELFLEYLKE